MNQILYNKLNKKHNRNKFIVLFVLSLILIIILIIYLIHFYINLNKNEQLSKNILSSFSIEQLYSLKNQNLESTSFNAYNDYATVGIIEIPKIKIKYPILSNLNDEVLKVSACRFYGPYPNKIGNMCIAAHNYDDNRFFGNLNLLNINDEIRIYDINNNCIVYNIYNKFETTRNDISCTNQDTNNKREITLVTCNNINKNRLIVKAVEKNFYITQ